MKPTDSSSVSPWENSLSVGSDGRLASWGSQRPKQPLEGACPCASAPCSHCSVSPSITMLLSSLTPSLISSFTLSPSLYVVRCPQVEMFLHITPLVFCVEQRSVWCCAGEMFPRRSRIDVLKWTHLYGRVVKIRVSPLVNQQECIQKFVWGHYLFWIII